MNFVKTYTSDIFVPQVVLKDTVVQTAEIDVSNCFGVGVNIWQAAIATGSPTKRVGGKLEFWAKHYGASAFTRVAEINGGHYGAAHSLITAIVAGESHCHIGVGVPSWVSFVPLFVFINDPTRYEFVMFDYREDALMQATDPFVYSHAIAVSMQLGSECVNRRIDTSSYTTLKLIYNNEWWQSDVDGTDVAGYDMGIRVQLLFMEGMI